MPTHSLSDRLGDGRERSRGVYGWGGARGNWGSLAAPSATPGSRRIEQHQSLSGL